VFDQAFFGKELARRARELARERGGFGLRVEIVTKGGERLDVLRVEAEKERAILVTRDERLVFLPYGQIAHVDVAPLLDHRIEAFELPAGAE
jgi:hypothetical protein